MLDDTGTVPTSVPQRSAPRRSAWGQAVMWWTGTTEITELTRDRALEDRVRAEAAVRLAPGPWAIADLFRRR
ncbi:hypothetical protein [Curtobacterium sp. MCBA15_001]|uniref:hypothetical protein n=1 Tax=Curtobacterium sp. MCBA15_001 TaxID=1898731 RepID=UPI00111381B8|nr:hypothetical protein [Curtobacterium sp. MCBA15_001]